MRRCLFIFLFSLFLIYPGFSASETVESVDPAIASLHRKFAKLVVGVSIRKTVKDDEGAETTTVVWTPGVLVTGGVLLSASRLPEKPHEDTKYRIFRGKLCSRSDLKAVNQRANISVLTSTLGAGLSFSSDRRLDVGSKGYAFNVLPPETGYVREVVQFSITSIIERQESKLYVTDLILPSLVSPKYIGCPAFDASGKVLGLLNVVRGDQSNTVVLCPSSYVRKAMASAIDPRDSTLRRCWFGAYTRELTPEWVEKLGFPSELQGSLVEDVIQGSPAALAGLKSRDVITAINGIPITGPDAEQLNVYFSNNFRPGTKVKLSIFRDKKKLELIAKLTERPLFRTESPKYVDDNLGIEVRNLTTDIRLMNGIEMDAQGVIVYDFVARKPFQTAVNRVLGLSHNIFWGMVVTELNGTAISSVEDFKSSMAKARKAKDKYVTLFVRYNRQNELGCHHTVFIRASLEE